MKNINVENTEHIVNLAHKMNEFLLKKCEENKKLSGVDLYVACKYLAHIYGAYLGPEAVKKLESNLSFINIDNVRGSS